MESSKGSKGKGQEEADNTDEEYSMGNGEDVGPDISGNIYPDNEHNRSANSRSQSPSHSILFNGDPSSDDKSSSDDSNSSDDRDSSSDDSSSSKEQSSHFPQDEDEEDESAGLRLRETPQLPETGAWGAEMFAESLASFIEKTYGPYLSAYLTGIPW